MFRLLPTLGIALFLCACAVDMPAVPMRNFVDGDIATVASAMQSELENGDDENRALVLNILAQCEQLLGDHEAAWRHFGEAGRIMGNWSTSGSEEFAAIVGSEGSKTYKGDPYERAMSAFYLALNYLWRGEPDNARAVLKRGILADAEVGDEEYQADNPLLFWLAGRMSTLMGKAEDARDFFAEAATANTFAMQHGSRGDANNQLFGRPGAGNVVMLVECGLGPEKFAAGHMEELASFRPRFHPAQRCFVSVDGKPVGETAVIADVFYQANTLGGTEMEGIRKGKAVFKTGALVAGQVMLQVALNDRNRDRAATTAIVGGGLLLLGLLTSTAADVRHWPTLPATVQALTIDLAPGTHTIELRFADAVGTVLPDLQQSWSIQVPSGTESYYLFRSLPGLDHLAQPPAATAETTRIEMRP